MKERGNGNKTWTLIMKELNKMRKNKRDRGKWESKDKYIRKWGIN